MNYLEMGTEEGEAILEMTVVAEEDQTPSTEVVTPDHLVDMEIVGERMTETEIETENQNPERNLRKQTEGMISPLKRT